MSQNHYHAFLCHNGADKPSVEALAQELEKRGLACWLDKWNLIPGDPWQPALEAALGQCDTCVIFFGPNGLGPWHNEEMRLAIHRRASSSERKLRVLPVILPGGQRARESDVPGFLQGTLWVDFRQAVDEEDALHRLVCGIKGIPPGRGPGATISTGDCPYVGLRTFQPDDAPLYFGRTAKVQELVGRLGSNFGSPKEERFLALIGASGSGKSSLALAGLIPALRRAELPGSDEWLVVRCRPGARPWENLQIALSNNQQISPHLAALPTLISRPEDGERRLHLTAQLALHEQPESSRLFLFVDQFEETFSLCRDEAVRRQFIDNILYAAGVAGGRTIVVLTMRADFYGECANYPGLRAAISDHQSLIGSLSEQELHDAIESPAQLAGGELEPGLMELLLADMKSQAGALPFLEHALFKLWERRDGRRLSAKAYMEMGSLGGALDLHAEEFFIRSLTSEEQALCRQVLLDLVHPGQNAADTKKRVSIEEVAPTDAARAMLKRLADARLVTTSSADQSEPAQAELAHEALISGWRRLSGWIIENRDRSRLKERLLDSAHEWERSGKAEDFLYRGAQLAAAEENFDPGVESLPRLGREFLDASIAARQDEQEARHLQQRREIEAAQRLARAEAERAAEAENRAEEQNRAAFKLRRRAYVAGTAAVAALILLVLSGVMWRTARKQAQIANRQRLAAESSGRQANDARNQADGLINFMLTDLQNKLKPIGRLDVLDDVARRASEYLAGLPKELVTPSRLRQQSWMLNNLGNVLRAQGKLDEALKVYQQDLTIAKRLSDQDKPDAGLQGDVLIGYVKVGDVLQSQGRLQEGEDAYQQGLTIAKRLTGQDRSNAIWLRDLSMSYQRIGDVLVAQGKLPEALDVYQQSLEIEQKLTSARQMADQDKSKAGWQRDLSVSYVKVGDVLTTQGKLPEALDVYQQSLAIAKRLAEQDNLNAVWQRDLSVSEERVGDVLKAQGKLPEAQDVYEQSLDIRQRLADRDGSNTGWQRDLSVSNEKIGDVLKAEGKFPEALGSYQQSLIITKRLAEQDKSNADWQRDLLLLLGKVANVTE